MEKCNCKPKVELNIRDMELILDGLKQKIEGYSSIERNGLYNRLFPGYEEMVRRKDEMVNTDVPRMEETDVEF